ncbi:unnamed protein product [Mycena citricolor]|uniref:Uncharacterized protein n=1 Tax=Mycena citricolor TaxID=2018698 RepID=A0AAD2H2V2_9AGAR|nr:unnamed protein product [Mycena citricolor]
MPSRHIMTLLAPAWGHTLPYIHLSTRMLAQDPELGVTIVQHNLILPKLLKELSACAYDKDRLRIKAVGVKEVKFSPEVVEEANKQLAEGWLDFLTEAVGAAQPLAWPKPHTVHMDFFVGGFVINPTKAILGPATKVVLWCSAGVTICPDHFGEYNFGKIAREIFADEERRAGRSLEEILGDVVVAWNGSDKLDGRVVDLVGALQIYDYERNAQGAGGPRQIAPVWAAAQELAAVADALLCPASSALEPLGAPYCRQYYESRGKELFLVGPQMNDTEWEVSVVGTGPGEPRVKAFLDDSLAKYGPKSVMYISFGSLFFPVATPHLVETMIQVLLDLEPPLPFILVLGGAMATLPDETIDRVHSSGRGLVCDFWVDQKAILKSGAVGWFLTHGGYNSLTESLSQGIPLIFWPIAGEQATNAAMFSTGSNPIGIELFQTT